jgi:hypothetical protein
MQGGGQHNRKEVQMERITAIEVRQLVGSNALSVRGTELRLNDAQLEQLDQLNRQMQAYYPHQEFAEETIRGFQFDLERLAVMYGVYRLQTALLNIRIKPGQKFFPHPSEVSEELEALVKKEKQEAREANPYVPCGRCVSGMILEFRNDGRFAVRCACWTAWKAGTPQEDRKSKAGGQ